MTDYPPSFYASAAHMTPPRPAFAGKAKADVAIIGGGFTGLCAALHLVEAGARVVLLEAARVGYAASGRNGGQIHSGFRKSQLELEHWLGRARAKDLWNIAEEGKALIREHVRRHKISCALKEGVIIAAHSKRTARELSCDAEFLNTNYGYPQAMFLSAEEANRTIGTEVYFGGLLDRGGGHMQPLAFALGVAKAAEESGAQIYEETPALHVEQRDSGVTIKGPNGFITSDFAIIACDAAIPEIAPELEPYLASVQSHIVATEPLPPALRSNILKNGAAVADTRHVVDYYRMTEDGRLLFAGGEYLWGTPRDIFKLVRPHMLRVFPQLLHVRLTHGWGGTVSVTRTRMPHFGWLGPRVLFGYGYSGQGVTLSVVGGKVLAEAALGHSDRFELLASLPPERFPGGRAMRRPLVMGTLLFLKFKDLLG